MDNSVSNSIYNSSVTCPVCGSNFEVTKVKIRSCKVASRDSDFCTYYENINPLLYDVWVCENCGYSAMKDKFEKIGAKSAAIIRKEIKPRWTKRSFSGERTVDGALEAFKLALYNLQVRNAPCSEFAKVCLRIAWLYRFKGDKEKERQFLEFSLKNYYDAYQNERFPLDKLDEFTCIYLIAELNRRLDEYEEALKWFSKLISSPEARKNAKLMNTAREQLQVLREQMGRHE
ncbi:DUF2225 domain-containing protein [Clostridium thermosuccinogenes]|uniref:DUF2225 domain-containing protein n=1 Tax=Clostridium thermosuccinogenes TaxID=84032 RepID=UPI000CCC2A20|nr:DUF2225 domain-containing protein [Pseudoclostridium thermosuccinogenes]PNT92794.1 hypothetical protein CDQ83_04340 [Pseudoclostridium thermosuccinogenes]